MSIRVHAAANAPVLAFSGVSAPAMIIMSLSFWGFIFFRISFVAAVYSLSIH